MENENVFDEVRRRTWTEVQRLAVTLGLILERYVVKVIDEHKAKIDALVDTGTMRKGIHHTIVERWKQITIDVLGNTFYTAYVHEGTKPHFPPVQKIAQWVARKGVGSGKFAKNKSYKELSESKEIQRIAWAIAISISKKGTKGIKFFNIAWKQAQSQVDLAINNFNNGVIQ